MEEALDFNPAITRTIATLPTWLELEDGTLAGPFEHKFVVKLINGVPVGLSNKLLSFPTGGDGTVSIIIWIPAIDEVLCLPVSSIEGEGDALNIVNFDWQRQGCFVPRFR